MHVTDDRTLMRRDHDRSGAGGSRERAGAGGPVWPGGETTAGGGAGTVEPGGGSTDGPDPADGGARLALTSTSQLIAATSTSRIQMFAVAICTSCQR
jgi:hypothetical protein